MWKTKPNTEHKLHKRNTGTTYHELLFLLQQCLGINTLVYRHPNVNDNEALFILPQWRVICVLLNSREGDKEKTYLWFSISHRCPVPILLPWPAFCASAGLLIAFYGIHFVVFLAWSWASGKGNVVWRLVFQTELYQRMIHKIHRAMPIMR